MTHEAGVAGRAWLNQLAVDPSMQRSGVASQLWRLGRDWARSAGATSIGVDTAEPAENLVALYTRWGFQHRGTVHWTGKTYDSVVMVTELTAHPDLG